MMIQNVSGASALLSQLMNQNALPGATSLTGAGSSAGAGAGVTGASAAQDLQSFMSALIQELRASGTAATGASTPGGVSSGSSVALAGVHQGHGTHGHGQGGNAINALLQQLDGSSATTGPMAGTGLTGSGAAASSAAANAGVQAAFQRLMQDLASLQKTRSTVSVSA
jgi:hypothetical protein